MQGKGCNRGHVQMKYTRFLKVLASKSFLGWSSIIIPTTNNSNYCSLLKYICAMSYSVIMRPALQMLRTILYLFCIAFIGFAPQITSTWFANFFTRQRGLNFVLLLYHNFQPAGWCNLKSHEFSKPAFNGFVKMILYFEIPQVPSFFDENDALYIASVTFPFLKDMNIVFIMGTR